MDFSNVPIHSRIITEQLFVSEDFALKKLINEFILSADNILVFDRGIQARATFVSRLNN
jgi:hypothetical protein